MKLAPVVLFAVIAADGLRVSTLMVAVVLVASTLPALSVDQ